MANRRATSPTAPENPTPVGRDSVEPSSNPERAKAASGIALGFERSLNREPDHLPNPRPTIDETCIHGLDGRCERGGRERENDAGNERNLGAVTRALRANRPDTRVQARVLALFYQDKS